MLLMPRRDWRWSYQNTSNALSISLGSEMEFLTPYGEKLLIPDALKPSDFEMEQAKYYISLMERLHKQLSISDAQLVQIVLNATAAHFMLKPQMPKSWFFSVSEVCVYCEIGKLFDLQSQSSRVLVLVVDNGLQAAQVMLLSPECQLAENRKLKRFDTIKVMHDRLMPIRTNHQVFAA